VGMLEKIRKKCFHFLWIGRKKKDRTTPINWKRIAKTKEVGG